MSAWIMHRSTHLENDRWSIDVRAVRRGTALLSSDGMSPVLRCITPRAAELRRQAQQALGPPTSSSPSPSSSSGRGANGGRDTAASPRGSAGTCESVEAEDGDSDDASASHSPSPMEVDGTGGACEPNGAVNAPASDAVDNRSRDLRAGDLGDEVLKRFLCVGFGDFFDARRQFCARSSS